MVSKGLRGFSRYGTMGFYQAAVGSKISKRPNNCSLSKHKAGTKRLRRMATGFGKNTIRYGTKSNGLLQTSGNPIARPVKKGGCALPV